MARHKRIVAQFEDRVRLTYDVANGGMPISTRLKSILDMRRFDPAGQPHTALTYVFGTEIGSRLLGFTRAWRTAVLKSHGHTPVGARWRSRCCPRRWRPTWTPWPGSTVNRRLSLGQAPSAGVSRRLFQLGSIFSPNYDVSTVGQRFLVWT
jgi:hypothetical protein